MNFGTLTMWCAGATLLGVAIVALLQRRAASRLRNLDPADISGVPGVSALLYRFTRNAGRVLMFVMVAIMSLALWTVGFTSAADEAYGLTILIASTAAMTFAITWARLGLEQMVRPPAWSRRAMLRIHVYFNLPLLGTLIVAAAGQLLTIALLDAADLPAPKWTAAVWLLVALAIVVLWPSHRLLGRTVPPPPELDEAYRERAGIAAPPPLVVIDSGGAGFVNAFAFWRPGRKWTAAGDGLVACLDRDETVAILMHELGHHVHNHPRLYFLTLFGGQTAATALLMWLGAASFVTALCTLAIILSVVIPWLSRRAERQCDQFAAARTPPGIYATALRKIHAANYIPAQYDNPGSTTHPDLKRRLESINADTGDLAIQNPPRPISNIKRRIAIAGWGVCVVLVAMLVVVFTVATFIEPWKLEDLWWGVAAITWLLYMSLSFMMNWLRRREPLSPALPAAVAATFAAYWPVIYIAAIGASPWLIASCGLAIFAAVWILLRQLRRFNAPPPALNDKQPNAEMQESRT